MEIPTPRRADSSRPDEATFEDYLRDGGGFHGQCLCRRITDLTSSYTDTTEKRCIEMAETSKKHDRELRRKEKKAAREARHNARNAA